MTNAPSHPAPPPLSLSTSWLSAGAAQGADIARAAADTGLVSLELEYRLSVSRLRELRRELRPSGLAVASVHNFCPFPPELAGARQPSGDLFNLASPEREERGLAVRHTLATLELAHDLEARAVVLHLGWAPDLEDRRVTGQAALAGGPTPELREAERARRAASPRLLDAMSFSLERLLERALSLGVDLGLENRFHLFQAPDLAELEGLLGRFAGGPLGYWHDTGHARHREMAGLNPAAAYLERLGDRLLGCHLHDIKGVEDHLPPGWGDLNWDDLCRRLLPAPLKVIELRPGPSPEQVGQAASWLAGRFAQAREAARREREGRG